MKTSAVRKNVHIQQKDASIAPNETSTTSPPSVGYTQLQQTGISFYDYSWLNQVPAEIIQRQQCHCRKIRAVPNILFIFYSGQIVGRIVYSYSAE